MEYIGKEKRPYHGIAFPFIVLLAFPVGMFFLFRFFLSHYTSYPEDVLNNMAMGFAGLNSTLFGLWCMLTGFIHDLFLAMITRIKDVFLYFDPFSKEAVRWYFYSFLHDGGIIMWLFLIILAANIVITILGFTNFFNWYYAG